MKFSGFLALSAMFFLASCHQQKKVAYNYIENARDTLTTGVVKFPEPVIQKADLLSIHVYSLSTKPEVSDELYNPVAINGTAGASSGNTSERGYLVDVNGNIRFPRLGVVHAEGLTKDQLTEVITAKITDLDSPTVIIRFLNFRVTVLGEVGRQGTYTIPYERVTIFEAIGLAGDIPVTGKRDNVRILREINGNREIGTIDLTSKNVFESPYYNLQQNDVLLVDVKKSKVKQVDQALVVQRITFALSLVTSIALLYNIFK